MKNRTVGWRTSGQAMKALHRGVRALGLAIALAGAAQAEPVGFNFEIDFINGPVAGQTALGTFTVSSDDCAAFVCSGIFTPSGPANFIGPTGTLLAFQIVVDGVTFSASSDDGYPDFPMVTLENNVLTGIDFMDFGAAPLYDPPALSISFHSFGGGPLTGTGAYTNANFESSDIGSLRQIPEPATALLMAGALVAGLSASRRRSLR